MAISTFLQKSFETRKAVNCKDHLISFNLDGTLIYYVRNNVLKTHDRYITTYYMTVMALSLLFIYVKFYLYLDSFCLLCKTICMPQVGPNWK